MIMMKKALENLELVVGMMLPRWSLISKRSFNTTYNVSNMMMMKEIQLIRFFVPHH
jgi:hypothetical protein